MQVGKHPKTNSDICTFLYFSWFFEFRLFVFVMFSAIPVSLITVFYVLLAIKLRGGLGTHETLQAKRAARMVVGFVVSFIVLSMPLQVSVVALCVADIWQKPYLSAPHLTSPHLA